MSDILPTKSNLIKLKKTITLSKQGQELLEKKKYILIKEKEKYYSKKITEINNVKILGIGKNQSS